jgi:ABC-type transporter Mla subunit MlaD
MTSQRMTDALIGALVIGAVIILVAAFVLTKGWNKRQFDLYMRTESARDLNSDTQVLLQSLPIGEVKAIAPQVDSLTSRLRFIVHLRINERYQDGTELRLPLGTQADIVSSNMLGGVGIELRMPERPIGRLAPGDTIGSTVKSSGLEAIAQIADSLRQQLALVLTDTRTLIDNLSRTVVLAQRELEQTAPEVRATMTEIQASLALLRPTLARADTLMATATGRMGGVSDSIAVTLSQTKSMIAHLDSLALTASSIAGENRAVVRTTAENLYVISAKLEHFLDQVSRRPLRMLYGVRPLPDSVRRLPPENSSTETSAQP